MIRWWFRGSVQVLYNNAINADYCGQRAVHRPSPPVMGTFGGTHTRAGAFDQFLIELRSKRGMHFYADVGWINAFLPNTVGLVTNDIPRAYPSSGRSIEAAAQHAIPPDAAARRARSCVFTISEACERGFDLVVRRR
jgi:hypothetical protein